MTCGTMKVGGLGDVLTGLCRSLQKKGHLVEAILPKYDCMDYSRIINLRVHHLTSGIFGSYLKGEKFVVLSASPVT